MSPQLPTPNAEQDVRLIRSIDDVAAVRHRLLAEEALVIREGLKSDNPVEIMKAMQMANRKLDDVDQRQPTDRKSYILDPLEFAASMGYKERPVSMSYHTLNRMGRTPIPNAIIKTRINQIASFCEPPHDDFSSGFRIQKKRGYLPGQQPKQLTKDEEKKIDFLTEWVLNCGGAGNRWDNDDFDTFCRKVMRDSLTFDQMCFEVIRDRRGRPVEIVAVDAATIRVAESYDDHEYQQRRLDDMTRARESGKVTAAMQNAIAYYRTSTGVQPQDIKGYFPSYVQIYQGIPQAEFYPWELCFGVRNPVTNINARGYGVSELEDLVNTVTALLWAEEYNRRFFSQGSAPKGIIRVKGNVPEDKLQQFKQQWISMISGVYNSWKTPVMHADEMDWVDLQRTNRDMEYTQWMEFLIKISSAVFQIDPTEIGFLFQGGAGEGGGMFKDSGEARMKHSKDKGLYPTLKFLQAKMNKYVVNALDPEYEFVFVGIDGQTYEQTLEQATKRVTNFTTINEERMKMGLKPLEDGKNGDLILNPTYYQAVAADKVAQQQQQQMDASEGEPQDGFGIDPMIDPQQEEEGGESGNDFADPASDSPFAKSIREYFSK